MSEMRAIVAYPNGDIRLETAQKPELGQNRYAPHDVLCQVEYCGICGSDIHRWREDKTGVSTAPRRVVAGHEIVSRVVAIGEAVSRVKVGDRVVHEIVTNYCGHCPACLEGRYNICNALPPMEGRAHYTTGGGFAKYTVWPEYQLHVLDPKLNPKTAVLMEPTAGSVHSVVTRMNVKPGESVAILGPGARGILMMQVCKAIGAGPVIMTGVTRDESFRLPMAKQLGADYIVNVEREDLSKVVNRITGGYGVDVVLENTGAVEPISQSLDIVRKGGRVLWAGGGIRGGISAAVDTHKIIVKEIEVRGEISQIPYDWSTAIKLVESGAVKLDPLVTNWFDLDHWEQAFDMAHDSHDCLRVAIDLTGEPE